MLSIEIWPKIWKLHVTNVVKNFLWRASLESIPTKLNLFKTKVVESSHCLICLSEPESVIHALWSCKAAQDVWGSSSRRLQKCSVEVSSFHNLLFHFFTTMPVEVLVEIVVIAHWIWKGRNLVVFEVKFISLEKLVLQAHYILEDYRCAVIEIQTRVKNSRTNV